MDALLLLLSLVLYSAAPVHPRGVVCREAGITNSRQVVSLGGLFIVSGTKHCTGVLAPSVERTEAMVFAIRKINHDPSLLPGVNLTFDIRETCTSQNVALEQAIEYVQNSDASCTNQTTLAVSGVVGSLRSSVSESVASLLRLFQLPQISYGSTADFLSDSSRFDYFFCTVPSDSLQARAMADIIEHFNWTYVFALFSDDTYGREGIDALIADLKSRNGSQSCIAMRISLDIESSDSNLRQGCGKDESGMDAKCFSCSAVWTFKRSNCNDTSHHACH